MPDNNFRLYKSGSSYKIKRFANAQTGQTFYNVNTKLNLLYGIDDLGVLREIDPVNLTTRQIYDTGFPWNGITGPNAVSYDSQRDIIYFLRENLDLYYVNANNDLILLTNLGSYFSSQPANASFYNNAIWIIQDGTNVLYKLNIIYSGNSIPSLGTVTTYTIANAGDVNNIFGDIAINVNTGILYCANTNGTFYSLNLNGDPSNTRTLIKASGINPSIQLAFNNDYSILYAQNYADGQWYTINTTNGNLTALNFYTVFGTGNTGFRDLAGARTSPKPQLISSPSEGTLGSQSFNTLQPISMSSGMAGQSMFEQQAVVSSIWQATAFTINDFRSTNGGINHFSSSNYKGKILGDVTFDTTSNSGLSFSNPNWGSFQSSYVKQTAAYTNIRQFTIYGNYTGPSGYAQPTPNPIGATIALSFVQNTPGTGPGILCNMSIPSPIGSQRFGSSGISGTNLVNASSFNISGLTANTTRSQSFAIQDSVSYNFGTTSFSIATGLSFSNTSWGSFSGSKVREDPKTSTSRTFVVLGVYTSGTGTTNITSPISGLMTINLTQSGTGQPINFNSTLNIPAPRTYESPVAGNIILSNYLNNTVPAKIYSSFTGKTLVVPPNCNVAIFISSNGIKTYQSVTPGQVLTFRSDIACGEANDEIQYSIDNNVPLGICYSDTFECFGLVTENTCLNFGDFYTWQEGGDCNGTNDGYYYAQQQSILSIP
jgi:hypothetical protein